MAMTIKLSPDQTKSLINLYQLHECLWNIHSPSYHDRIKKRRAGQKIADALELPVDAVLRKWANLRTYYLKETQKLEKKNSEVEGTDQVYQSDWLYFDQMHEFMQNQFHRRSFSSVTSSSYTRPDDEDDQSGSSDSQRLQLPEVAGGGVSDIDSASFPATTPGSQPAVNFPTEAFENGLSARKRRKKQKQTDEDDPLVAVMRDAVQAMSSATESDREGTAMQDELDDYAKTVANSLRSITDVRLREQTKLRINELLFEARFGC